MHFSSLLAVSASSEFFVSQQHNMPVLGLTLIACSLVSQPQHQLPQQYTGLVSVSSVNHSNPDLPTDVQHWSLSLKAATTRRYICCLTLIHSPLSRYKAEKHGQDLSEAFTQNIQPVFQAFIVAVLRWHKYRAIKQVLSSAEVTPELRCVDSSSAFAFADCPLR